MSESIETRLGAAHIRYAKAKAEYVKAKAEVLDARADLSAQLAAAGISPERIIGDLKQRRDVSDLVRKLRRCFGETQDDFARRLDVAVVTVARWETSRPPDGKALLKLANLARANSFDECAALLDQARIS